MDLFAYIGNICIRYMFQDVYEGSKYASWRWGGGGRGDLLTTTSLSLSQIKTTAPLRYKVRPNLALIDPKSVAKIHVLLVPGKIHCLTCS